jgi:hypothetical protein
MEKLLRIIKNSFILAPVMMMTLLMSGCFEHAAVGAVWTGGFLIYGPIGVANAISNSAKQAASDREYLEEYPEKNCPAGFIEVCRLAAPGQVKAGQAVKVYETAIRLLEAQPLPLDDRKSNNVIRFLRQAFFLAKSRMSRDQLGSVLNTVNTLADSERPGDTMSAAIIAGAAARSLLPSLTFIYSPKKEILLKPAELETAAKIAAAAVMAYEKVLPGSKNDQAIFCLGSAYQLAEFLEKDPLKKKQWKSKAFNAYKSVAAVTNNYIISILALSAGSQSAASDSERLELANTIASVLRSLAKMSKDGRFHIQDDDVR